jgi:hypothetical protein
VDEVVDDVCPVNRSSNVGGGSGVALEPADALLLRVVGARDSDELVVGREEREKCAPDDPGRAEDRDLHALALAASNSK